MTGIRDRAEPEAADDQARREQPRAGARAGEGEGEGGGGDDDEAGDRDPAGADRVGEPPSQLAGQQCADALRDEHDPGGQRRGAAHLLVVQGQQQHGAVEGKAGEEQHRGGRGDRTVPQQAHVHQGGGAPQGVAGEAGQQRDADGQRDDDIGVREAGRAARVAQAENERGDAGAEQGQARQVQVRPRPGRVRGVRGHVPRGQEQADEAERHVDPEHEPPAEVGQDRAADERAEDRAEQGGQRDDGDGPAERLASRGLHDQRGQHRKHDAAAGALHEAPGDQRVDVPGQAGADRADQEDGESRHPQPLAAEALQPPGGQRHRDAQGEQVTGADPLDRRYRCVQLYGQGVQGDADDRGVEDDGQRADNEDQGTLEHLRVDPVLARIRGRAGGHVAFPFV